MKYVVWALTSLVITACAYKPTHSPKAASDALTPETPKQAKPASQQGIPSDVQAFLEGDITAEDSATALLNEPRFVLQARQVDAQEFFQSLGVDSPYNIVVHPDVSGKISVNLKDVTVDETLDVIADMYGYEIRRDNRMIQIYPAGVRTQTFQLDYLSLRRFGLSQTEISSGGVSQERDNGNGQSNNNNGRSNQNNTAGLSPLGGSNEQRQSSQFNQNQMQGNGSSVVTQSQTALWDELEDMLKGVVGTDGTIVLSPQAGLVSVTAPPNRLRAVGDFIETLEDRLQRQVILEARIIEVTLNDSYQQGINWSELDTAGSGFDVTFDGATPGNQTSAAIGGLFGLSFRDQNFTGVIEMLQTQGSVQVLSNPRVSAANNQKAVIKIGEDEYYVTNVTSSTNLSNSGSNDFANSNVDLTPFFSGISLDVTPQISDNGEVILHVHPSVVETQEQQKVITLTEGELVLPLARSNIRESDTIVKARNGEIVVLGGLMQTSTSEEVGQVPLLGDLPLIGNLFKNRRNSQEKKELVILIKPTVIGVDTWRKELRRSQELLETWFPELNTAAQ